MHLHPGTDIRRFYGQVREDLGCAAAKPGTPCVSVILVDNTEIRMESTPPAGLCASQDELWLFENIRSHLGQQFPCRGAGLAQR